MKKITLSNGQTLKVEKGLFNLLSILASYAGEPPHIKLAIALNYGHLPEYELICRAVYEIDVLGYRKGYRNVKFMSLDVYFNE